jgi:hypothetical protein
VGSAEAWGVADFAPVVASNCSQPSLFAFSFFETDRPEGGLNTKGKEGAINSNQRRQVCST